MVTSNDEIPFGSPSAPSSGHSPATARLNDPNVAVLARNTVSDMPFWSAAQLAQAIRQKKIGSLELLKIHLARVEKHNPRLNAIVELDAAGARKRAQAADDAVMRGDDLGPLHGVPITIKDSIDVAGLKSTWAMPEYKNNRAAQNAVVVDGLTAGGAIVFGKTNMPWAAQNWETYNEIYGTTNNPWDLSRSPGGSSGGAATAVAAGLSALEVGSDSAGGLRNPAHYCGIYSHRPTYGITPGKGQSVPGIGILPDMMTLGPMARSAADLVIALDLMTAPDEAEAVAWHLALPKSRHARFSDFKVAFMLEYEGRDVDRELQARLQDVADFLIREGAKVSMQARPEMDFEAAHNLFLTLYSAAASGGLPELYWKMVLQMARFVRNKNNSELASVLRGYTQRHRDWIRLDLVRTHLRATWASFFRDYDLLVCPVAATAALPHDQSSKVDRFRHIVVNGKRVSATDQWFWPALASVASLPSTIAPAGFLSGLPVGMQIIGPRYGDHTCLAFAGLLEQNYQGFVPPKGWE